MNLYRSVQKQTGGTEVYIDGSKSSASRIDLNSIQIVPDALASGQVLVLNNEVHYIEARTSGTTKHYKWNGTTWAYVSDLPYNIYFNKAVVYNNEIHIIGGYASSDVTKHYKWNGSSWVEVATLPVGDKYGNAIVFDNEIHIFFASSFTIDKHYKWNGSSWSEVNSSISLLNIALYCNSVVYNNKIHILGKKDSTTPLLVHYLLNGTTWEEISGQPSTVISLGSTVVYNNEIHYIYGKYHAKWNGTTWTDLSDNKIYHSNNSCEVYNNKIYGFGNGNGSIIEPIGQNILIQE